ncbi:MAG: HD domain-containing protein [Planctomycetota bacterium]|jgi:hypothetical protein
MSELDIVRDLAKQALTISTPTSEVDCFLWDRARRLVRNSEHICRLPEVAKAEAQIDHFALITATYFSDVGLASHLNSEKAGVESAIPNNNNDDLLDLATLVVEETLGSAIGGMRTEKINRIITESRSRITKMLEAMILSDARNLDDMGATGVFNEFRRYIIGGKGVSDVLQIWKRKIDYRYWQARLKESFHFKSVRKIAGQRFSAAEYFMNQLKAENTASDIEELSIDSDIG